MVLTIRQEKKQINREDLLRSASAARTGTGAGHHELVGHALGSVEPGQGAE